MQSRLVSLAALRKQGAVQAQIGSKRCLVLDTPAGVRVVAAHCPHRGAPLVDGFVREGLLVCPWHRSVFSLETGQVVSGPCRRQLEIFEFSVSDGALMVENARGG
jgi:nitrite reductase/ring-hydroxylating ferredoxin subunit